ncbi:MAG: type II toxin-antitoxin system HicB family antitoxin [Methanoregulaceae archaeon]|jgi:predicted RNase H-like HicB family nuclease
MSLRYTVVLEPQEEGGYTVPCVELPGAISQGETREEALTNIREAIGTGSPARKRSREEPI